MRVGWTHSTLARLSLLTADRTLGAIDTPIAPIFCIADPGFFIGRIAAGGLIVAEVLGRPGYRENAVVRGSVPDPAILKNSSTSVSVTTSSV